jgi:hypothetical protein
VENPALVFIKGEFGYSRCIFIKYLAEITLGRLTMHNFVGELYQSMIFLYILPMCLQYIDTIFLVKYFLFKRHSTAVRFWRVSLGSDALEEVGEWSYKMGYMQYHRDLWGVTSFFNKTFSIATIMVSVLT